MDTRYTLVLLETPVARFPLAGSVTVGRHLDNDLVIAGEDVRDFHVRIETLERGPRVITLGAATAHLNRAAVEQSAGMKPGDELIIGHHRLRLDVESTGTVGNWNLHRVGESVGIAIVPRLRVGRAADCDLQLGEGHVSRHHAELNVIAGTIWLEDLGSANGTFVNGDRVYGAWRLFHGDEVVFDTVRYQLIGDAPDLTPIRPPGEPPDQLGLPASTPEPAVSAGHLEVVHTVASATADTVSMSATGPSLVGRSAPVAGRVFALAFGRQLIGRGPDAAIQLPEASVSLRHAELEVRPDGAQLMNLISTNGTWVNGIQTHTRALNDGDLIRIGRVTLQYREAPARIGSGGRRVALFVGSALLGVFLLGLAWLLLR